MENLKKHYILIIIALAGAGLLVQYHSSDLDLTYYNVETIKNNDVISKEILRPNSLLPFANLISNLLITLAISIFVSMFILKRVDDHEKNREKTQLEEIRRNINEDVFNSLFKTLMPHELYQVIKSDIIKSQLIRKNAVWVYDFKPTVEGGIELKQTLKSELHNIGEFLFEKGYEISFKTSRDISETKLDRFLYEFKGEVIEDLNSDDEVFSGNGVHTIPLKIPAGEYADVTLVFRTKYSSTEVADTYYSSQALINATLIANYPIGYKLTLIDSFSSEIRETSSDDVSSIHELKGAILPGQGMTFHLIKIT